MRRHALRLAIVVLAATLAACAGGKPRAPVKDQAVSRRTPEAPTREVRAGDTLYSIAWESGRDYHELAEWNGIGPPYLIRPGQVLRLYPPKGSSRPTTPGMEDDRRDAGGRASSGTNAEAEPRRERRPTTRPTTPPDKSGASSMSDAKLATSRLGPWRWPAEGKLIERFTPGGARGIAIAGKRGQAVYAAAPGTVVYRGSGLRGYGELIIIKHDADFLSAYAHNDRILVKEGNVIRRGQKIAEMGSSGSDRVKLHFEIRRRGVPVDPLIYLPKK